MKKLIILLSIIALSGCYKKDTMENITIYTTTYPVTYITERLYGEYSKINSIYPNGVNILLVGEESNDLYTLTDKQLSDYSKGDLFIFNSLLYEGNYVNEMFNNNSNLKIINATDHLSIDDFNGVEEIWLDPFRLLTVARNIKNGFDEYIENYYIKQDIENNFLSLKEDLDKLGSKLSEVTKNATNKNIVVQGDVFNFLSKDKYGLNVYSLENDNPKTISDVKTMIENGDIKYIYLKQYDEVNSIVSELIKDTDVEIIKLHMLVNLTENEFSNKKDYFSIMNENIDLLKKGLY